jgi:hypothetical protein
LFLVLGAGAGVGYGYFARQNNTSVDAGMGALGGGIAGLASGLGYSIVNGIGQALFSLLGIGLSASTADYENYGLPPELASQMAISAGTGIIGILFMACIVLFITGFLGAISGLIYGLATANQPVPPPSAPAM